MKSTGMVRKVDELGRVVLPIEIRRTMDIQEKDPLEIYVEGENIILRKYHEACVFCGSVRHFRRQVRVSRVHREAEQNDKINPPQAADEMARGL